MTLDQILALVQSGGVLTLTVAILFGGYKEVWYWGSQVRKLLAESLAREAEWKEMALRGLTVAEKTAEAQGRRRA